MAVVVDITDEGIVHVHPLSGSVASNAHLLEHRTESTDPASQLLPDPAEAGGTGGDETARPNGETLQNTGRTGAPRHKPARGSSNS